MHLRSTLRALFLCLVPAVGLPVSLSAGQSAAPANRSDTNHQTATAAATAKFSPELIQFQPAGGNPVFTAQGEGHWDATIRERGWILKTGELWRMWFTGYDGTREGQKMLGYATSDDGVNWNRHSTNPIYRDRWVEDMMVVRQDGTFYMFAEGRGDQAFLLKSSDGIAWTRIGTLDIRQMNGQPLSTGPRGTPTAWFEDGTWHLFYERFDKGVWLATSRDMNVWTNVSDDPVLVPGPGNYDKEMIALNQIVKHEGRYYAYYHGRGGAAPWDKWCTNIATSTDLRRWDKFADNPLQPVEQNKSSGIVVHDGKRFRLYTMHDKVELHLPVGE